MSGGGFFRFPCPPSTTMLFDTFIIADGRDVLDGWFINYSREGTFC